MKQEKECGKERKNKGEYLKLGAGIASASGLVFAPSHLDFGLQNTHKATQRTPQQLACWCQRRQNYGGCTTSASRQPRSGYDPYLRTPLYLVAQAIGGISLSTQFDFYVDSTLRGRSSSLSCRTPVGSFFRLKWRNVPLQQPATTPRAFLPRTSSSSGCDPQQQQQQQTLLTGNHERFYEYGHSSGTCCCCCVGCRGRGVGRR